MTIVGAPDHFDGRRFFNPTGPEIQPFTKVFRLLLEPKTRWPAHVNGHTAKPAPLGGSAAVVTFVGHSTFLIQTPAGNILTDPIYSERAGPWNLLGPAESIGMHFGPFQLTTEGIDDPLRGLDAALRERNIPASRFRAIGFGESIRVSTR